MSNENNEKYLDKPTGMFNQYALGVVMNEEIALNRNEYILVMTLSESENVQSSIDWKQYIIAMEQIQHFCKKDLKRQAYRVGDNGFAFLVHSAQSAERLAEAVKSFFENNCGSGMDLDYYNAIALNECGSIDELMSKIVEICTNAINKMAVYDFLTGVRNRNSFEKELSKLKNDGADVYYFIADLNNLKITNDAMGHSAGDELLQTVAKVLENTAGENGKVFRYGGDEFVILWNGTDADEYLKALEKNCEKLNKERIIPVSFAIGYGKILEEDGIQKADRMMYENKVRMKKAAAS